MHEKSASLLFHIPLIFFLNLQQLFNYSVESSDPKKRNTERKSIDGAMSSFSPIASVHQFGHANDFKYYQENDSNARIIVMHSYSNLIEIDSKP